MVKKSLETSLKIGGACQTGILAEKYQMTTGKWMIFVPTAGVDEVWGQIVKGLAGGLLGDHICGAKESKKWILLILLKLCFRWQLLAALTLPS